MLISPQTTKVSFTDLKNAAGSLPEGCIVRFKELVNKNLSSGEKIDITNLTPSAKKYAEQIIDACVNNDITNLCHSLYA